MTSVAQTFLSVPGFAQTEMSVPPLTLAAHLSVFGWQMRARAMPITLARCGTGTLAISATTPADVKIIWRGSFTSPLPLDTRALTRMHGKTAAAKKFGDAAL